MRDRELEQRKKKKKDTNTNMHREKEMIWNLNGRRKVKIRNLYKVGFFKCWRELF